MRSGGEALRGPAQRRRCRCAAVASHLPLTGPCGACKLGGARARAHCIGSRPVVDVAAVFVVAVWRSARAREAAVAAGPARLPAACSPPAAAPPAPHKHSTCDDWSAVGCLVAC